MLTFTGTIVGASQADRKAKQSAPEAALRCPAAPDFAGDDGYKLVLITDEDGVQKQCYARLVTPLALSVFDTCPDLRGIGFVMEAVDSALYGQTLHTATEVRPVTGTNFRIITDVSPTIPFQLYGSTTTTCTATNGGTIGAPPVVTVAGPTHAPVVTNETTGKSMSFPSLTLLAGESLVITVGSGTIYKYDADGVRTDASGYFDASAGQWLIVEPGANDFTLEDDSPDAISATLTVQWRDTYI